MGVEMSGASPPGSSAVPEPAWRTLRSLDPQMEAEVVTLATCLALAEQRFQLLFEDVLPRFAQTPDDLSGEADVLADAHHALTLLQESLHATSRRMLDVLDRVSRELGE
jgi:hypothetical protein